MIALATRECWRPGVWRLESDDRIPLGPPVGSRRVLPLAKLTTDPRQCFVADGVIRAVAPTVAVGLSRGALVGSTALDYLAASTSAGSISGGSANSSSA